MKSFKLNEHIFDFISDDVFMRLKDIKGEPITHPKYGEGTITNYEFDYDGMDDDLYSNWFTLKCDFNGKEVWLLYSFNPEAYFNYTISEKAKNILDNFWKGLQVSKEKSSKNDAEIAEKEAFELGKKHARDGFDVWYKYFTGKIKYRPTNPSIPTNFNQDAYLKGYKRQKNKQRHQRDIEELLSEISGSIEDSYSGDVKALIQWISDVNTSIELSPARDDAEGKEKIQELLDAIYDNTEDEDVKKVKIGNSSGDLKNYQIHLKTNALDTCPDIEAFLNWKILKYDFRRQEEKQALVYDSNQNEINSRRVVLDYLLNKKEYLEK